MCRYDMLKSYDLSQHVHVRHLLRGVKHIAIIIDQDTEALAHVLMTDLC